MWAALAFRGSVSNSMPTSASRDVDVEKGEPRRKLREVDGDGGQKPSTESKGSPTANGTLGGGNGTKENDLAAESAAAGTATASKSGRPRSTASVKPSPEEAMEMSVFQSPEVRDPDPAAERLARNDTPLSKEDFQTLMGLRDPTDAQGLEFPFKLAIKGGLFKTIHSEYESVQYRYRIFNVATYALLALQVIIGAIFIILGALRNAEIYVAISVLGAISTAIGGALALMKGQGLPNRLREARNRLRNVIFEAEELYWDFRSGRAIIYSDVKKLREDYLRVVEEMRRNHPDVWTDATTEAAKANRMKR